MKTTPPSSPDHTARTLRRAAKRPASTPAGTEPTLQESPALPPGADRIMGKIRLDATHLTPARTLAQLRRNAESMARTPAYAGLEALGEVQTAAATLGSLIDEIAATRQQLTVLLTTLQTTRPACAATLQRAASACEAADPNPATLTAGGWTLRRQPTPPQIMPIPADLRLRPTLHPGRATARWRTVPNARYYEVTLTPVPSAPLTIPQPLTLASPRASVPLPPLEPGTLLTLTVRAIGAKGPGPDSPGLVTRVN